MAQTSEKTAPPTEPFPDHENISDVSSLPDDRVGATSPPLDDEHPPPYGDVFGHIGANNAPTRASITDDGRINIRIDQNTKGLSSLLVPALRSQLDLTQVLHQSPDDLLPPPPYVPPALERSKDPLGPPPLNVVVHVVGSRGDVQPFVALGKVLQEKHRHRVRIATHPVFQDFVEENDLEFFSIGGDPSELMAYMVRNPGLMPGFDTLRSGDVGHRRHEIGKMVKGCWRSCFETGTGLDEQTIGYDDLSALAQPDDRNTGLGASRPFVADAIIANPPSFAHVHCAEKLGIPLHMMFTMPWSPTQAFPHPLANIQSTNAAGNMTNFISYALVDMMTWQGLGDVINRFREKSLGLEPMSLTWAPGMLARLRIPYTYCWSPALIPKPKDWADYIDISGFFFLSKSSGYTPEPDLQAFLNAGPPPVYIGFGSIVVDDPNAMTKLIFEAVKLSGQRALVSKGWGGFGADEIGLPESIFMIGNVPHDWLFQHVSCVVHHGGAGTTAAGIACGRPTVVVPFFGDQPFWGAMIARAGVGPRPLHSRDLTAQSLADAIGKALEPDVLNQAKLLSERITNERGSEVGAQSFHKQLDLDNLRCQLCPNRAAVWRIRRTDVRLSAFAAAVLSHEKLLDFKDLKLYRPREYEPDEGPVEPISGAASALIETIGSMAMGVADMPVATLRALRIHPESRRANSIASPTNRSRASSSASARRAGSGPRSPTTNNHELPLSPLAVSSRIRTASMSSQDTGAVSEEAAIAQRIGSSLGVIPSIESQADSQQVMSNQTRSRSGTSASSNKKKSFSLDRADLENALRTGKGAVQITTAAMKSPMDFSLGLAKGFHNAPKLYGDDTVRKQEKITSLTSGLRAAGLEFGYGFYDGISGLVTQPLQGARKEGAAGFVKGIGKGIGGVVLKPGAAVWGLPGYTAMGIYREIQNRFGPSTEGYIIASRTAQGLADMHASTTAEQASLVADWKEVKRFIYKRRNVGEEKMKEIQERIRRYTASSRDLHGDKDSTRPGMMERNVTTGTMSSGVYSPEESTDGRDPLSRAATRVDPESSQSAIIGAGTVAKSSTEQQPSVLNDEMEEAIRRSVQETSCGDAAQDASIERAIRASMVSIEERRAEGADDQELQVAMQASLSNAAEGRLPEQHEKQEQAELEAALQASREAHAEEDATLEAALQASRKSHEESQAKRREAQEEEEAVMRYIMKQTSLERGSS